MTEKSSDYPCSARLWRDPPAADALPAFAYIHCGEDDDAGHAFHSGALAAATYRENCRLVSLVVDETGGGAVEHFRSLVAEYPEVRHLWSVAPDALPDPLRAFAMEAGLTLRTVWPD